MNYKMTLEQIKTAVDEGKTVHWCTSSYKVVRGVSGYLIECLSNEYYTGLTWRDGVTLNGKENEFYIK